MDFITGLLRTLHGYNAIWVIVDRLTKSAHFFPVKANYSIEKYAELYITKIVCLHGVPKSIVSDRGPQFTARFWKSLMMLWALISLLAQLIILKQVDKPSESIKFLKICSDRVQLFMEKVGMNVCLFLSFHTTIVTKQVLGCLYLKLCMGGVVELLSIGRNPESEYTLARTCYGGRGKSENHSRATTSSSISPKAICRPWKTGTIFYSW